MQTEESEMSYRILTLIPFKSVGMMCGVTGVADGYC